MELAGSPRRMEATNIVRIRLLLLKTYYYRGEARVDPEGSAGSAV